MILMASSTTPPNRDMGGGDTVNISVVRPGHHDHLVPWLTGSRASQGAADMWLTAGGGGQVAHIIAGVTWSCQK